MARKPTRRKAPPPLSELEKRTYLAEILGLIARIEDADTLTVSLSINERRCIAEALRECWLPKHELRRVRRQRELQGIEALTYIGRYSSKLKAADVRDKLRAHHGFRTVGAMDQFVKRERKARKR